VTTSSLSGWSIEASPIAKAASEIDAESIQWRPQSLPETDVWIDAAQEQILREISALPNDWDASGASRISPAAIENARVILQQLQSRNCAPDFIVPTSSGTVQFDWERLLGTAHLEIGNTTFGFYTAPRSGESILDDGSFEALNAEEIRFAVASIDAGSSALSLADWGRPYRLMGRYTARAA
jgi:hypothetical protein